MSRRPSKVQQEQIAARILAGDPTVAADLYEIFFEPLQGELASKFDDQVRDPSMIDSIVIDTLLNASKLGARYDPARGSLWTYLYIDVEGDLRNELARLRKSKQQEVSLAAPLNDSGLSVEDLIEDRNVDIETQTLERLEPAILDSLPPVVKLETVLGCAATIVTNAKDEQLLHLILAGERRTETYAAILGIEELPADQQQRDVNRHKDRLKRRLTRLRDKLT
jgi:RNA polymerase sigma-70 factor (ECF subfamily)